MKTVALAFRYLWSRPLAAVLNLLLLTLGLASITFVVLASEQVSRSFQRNLAGIDLVVGAKGSPLQLILAGVFQIDVAPGNVPLAEIQALQKHPQVASLVPLAMGDSFGGFRILGTTQDYLAQYGLRPVQGRSWEQPMEAVLGAQVAAASGLKSGGSFSGNHGLGGGGHAHGDAPYRVAGVLAPCGCVADRLILTGLESVWQLHEKAGHGDGKAHEDEREVTMALIRYTTPLAAVSFPRMVNTGTSMQAAAPAVEVTRLLRMLGVGSEALQGLGVVLLVTAALSVFIALWNAVRERREDLAMLRMLGATPLRVALLMLCEALWLALLASLLGLGLGHGLTALVGSLLAAQQSLPLSGWTWVAQEIWIPVAALGVAFVAALIPALSAARVDVAQLLNAR
ncbi:FtsX-like permease family protein [uncultured Ramlibacter sp.]|uniref:FtsX-like permease family protein n=1 Tax=uncultured Ramlibacter sp. TaxID=260755 RepID=UPI0026106FB7|nr:FtsX-like permease family protein [uncultured Ramlibacter sp.]